MHPAERLRELETRARRRFGQNFLVASGIAEMIVTRAGVRPGERVLEIGPGLGVLTEALQKAGASVVAIELDRDLAAALPEVAPGVELIQGDAMRVALPTVDRVVANLPYNVASPLCLRLLELRVPMALMFQREVADRIEAEPGSRTYGSLSVQIQSRASVSRLVSLAPGCFHPAPKVHSAVVGFEPRRIEFDPLRFDRIVRLGFSARRKTLHNTFTAALGRDGAREFLVGCGIDPGARAETVSVPDWHRLAAAFPSVSG